MKILLYILLIISAIIDIRKRLVYTPLNILILTVSLLMMNDILNGLLALIVPLSLALINRIKRKEVIGYGDIELLMCLSPFLGYRNMVLVYFLSTVILFIFSLIYKKESVPYVPFLVISIIFTNLVV